MRELHVDPYPSQESDLQAIDVALAQEFKPDLLPHPDKQLAEVTGAAI